MAEKNMNQLKVEAFANCCYEYYRNGKTAEAALTEAYKMAANENYSNAQLSDGEKMFRKMIPLIKWTKLELVDGEGFEVKGEARMAALKELKRTNGIHQVFVQHEGREIDGNSGIDWTRFEG